LLLPEREDDEEPSGEELAAALAFQLRRLEAMRDAGGQLMARMRLWRDWFPRGAPEDGLVVRSNVYDVSLYDLLKAYAEHKRRTGGGGARHIEASERCSTELAIARLTAMLGRIPRGATLASRLPRGLKDPLQIRSSIAAHFLPSLELAREGKLELRQDGAFQ